MDFVQIAAQSAFAYIIRFIGMNIHHEFGLPSDWIKCTQICPKFQQEIPENQFFTETSKKCKQWQLAQEYNRRCAILHLLINFEIFSPWILCMDHRRRRHLRRHMESRHSFISHIKKKHLSLTATKSRTLMQFPPRRPSTSCLPRENLRRERKLDTRRNGPFRLRAELPWKPQNTRANPSGHTLCRRRCLFPLRLVPLGGKYIMAQKQECFFQSDAKIWFQC